MPPALLTPHRLGTSSHLHSSAPVRWGHGSEAPGMSVEEISQLQIRTDDERAGTSKSPVLAEKKEGTRMTVSLQ